MLSQLNSYIRPGLSERDFRALFVKCVCGLIMTRKSFKYHYCVDDGLRDRAEPEIIEITDSDD
jgi:hypothetical protein